MGILLNFAYDAVVAVAGVCCLAYQRLFRGKCRNSLWQRLGFRFPLIEKGRGEGGRRLIWIHAVSVGETKAVAAIAKKLRERDPAVLLVVSSITETGHAEAQRSLPFADFHVFLPLDVSWIIGPIVSRVAPDVVLIGETDLWYQFMRAAKRAGAFVALVNGKLSHRSAERLRKVPFFARPLLGQLDLFCLQSAAYLQRFAKLGVAPNKLVVTGNTKFSSAPEVLAAAQLSLLRDRLGVAAQTPVVVAGSTHAGEEQIILEAMESVWKEFPAALLLLVPRHPERFDTVAALLDSRGIRYRRWSLLDSQQRDEGRGSVILVDAMGVLMCCYQLATIAIVGGQLNPRCRRTQYPRALLVWCPRALRPLYA